MSVIFHLKQRRRGKRFVANTFISSFLAAPSLSFIKIKKQHKGRFICTESSAYSKNQHAIFILKYKRHILSYVSTFSISIFFSSVRQIIVMQKSIMILYLVIFGC